MLNDEGIQFFSFANIVIIESTIKSIDGESFIIGIVYRYNKSLKAQFYKARLNWCCTTSVFNERVRETWRLVLENERGNYLFERRE